MWLPNKENAFIPRGKLQNYLLSPNHPVGKSKAEYFSKLGFNQNNLDQLKNEILRIAHEAKVLTSENTPYGTKYIVEGSINTLDGPTIKIRTVWIIEIEGKKPRFVTAYPV